MNLAAIGYLDASEKRQHLGVIAMSRVVHFEIVDENTAGLRAFYESAFGWKISEWEGPFEYWMASTGDEGSPGIDGAITPPSEGEIQRVVLTIDVDDVDAAIENVKAAGGTVIQGKMPIPGIGWSALCADPAGIRFGVMQEDPGAA